MAARDGRRQSNRVHKDNGCVLRRLAAALLSVKTPVDKRTPVGRAVYQRRVRSDRREARH
jgi:hypothetical protein